MKATVFVILYMGWFLMNALGQDDIRKQSARLSTLPATQQSAINSAIQRWNRRFKRKAKDDPANLGEALVAAVRLGSADGNELIVTDQSGCSPTGNCSVFVLHPTKDQYRVVLEGIGQKLTATAARTNGFRNINLSMHGSATMREVKVYKFNGNRYLRAGCYNENFEMLDTTGKLGELEKPRITSCR